MTTLSPVALSPVASVPFRRIKTAANRLLDAILPPRCPATGALVGVQGTLSPEYWSQLHFIQRPYCDCCGTPFPVATIDAMVCGECLTDPPYYTTARAALAYDDVSANLLLKFKYGDKTLLARSFADWMIQTDADSLKSADYFVPVPLHRWRLFKRRYNQAALLSYALSIRTGRIVLPNVLRRVKSTESQGHKSKAERQTNIRGAFEISSADQRKLRGKNVVLIDDVLTSGATANECAKVLLAAGAKRVDVLVLARVVRKA